MIKFTKPHFSFYILNGIAAVVYIVVFLNLNLTVSNEIAFSTPDAVTYKDVADWLAHGVQSESISTRPILFPLILLITTKLGGAYGIWIAQVIFWFLTINFTFLVVKQLTKNYVFAALGGLIIMSNLSLIAMTLHALTELITVFLLSAMLFFLGRKIEQFREVHFFHTCMFFLVLLSILKPVFSIPLFSILFIVFPLFYLRKHWEYPKNILKLFLLLLPLLVQLTIIKTKYNQTKISLISSMTLSEYLVPQGIQKIESISREEAVKKAWSFSSKEQANYIVEHLSTYSHLFKKNITDNITGKSTFLSYPKGHGNVHFAKFMKSYNENTLKVHYAFFILIIPLLFIFLIKKNYSILIFLMFIYGLGAYYVIVTGISFWQGDRLTLGSIGIWACLYPFILFSYFKLLYPTKPKLH